MKQTERSANKRQKRQIENKRKRAANRRQEWKTEETDRK